MKRSSDLVIIGGGVNGLSVAFNAAKMGLRALLFEKARLGGGATGRSGGGIRASFGSPETIQLAMESIRVWEQLSKELNFNVLFSQHGYLFLASSEEELQMCRELVSTQNSFGVGSRIVHPGDIKCMFPYIDVENVTGGIFSPKDGGAHHDAVIWGYAKAAQRFGVEIMANTTVTDILVGSGKVRGVVSDVGEVATDKVVNAASSSASQLAKKLGVDLPISVFRREVLVTEPLKHFLNPQLVSFHYGLHCHQTLRGEVVSITRNVGEPLSYNLRSSLGFMQKVSRELTSFIPGMRGVNVMRQWAGLYDMTPDGSPILGEVEGVEGFIQVNGTSGHGFMLAPKVGKLIADLIVNNRESPLLVPFRLSRFKEGRLVKEKTVLGTRVS